MNRQTSANDARDDDADSFSERPTGDAEMSVDEAVEVYANAWIFMEVTERVEHDHPLRGRILDHHRRRDQIQPTVMRVLTAVKTAGKAPEHVRGYYAFYGVRLFRTTKEWEDCTRRSGLSGGGRGHGRQ